MSPTKGADGPGRTDRHDKSRTRSSNRIRADVDGSVGVLAGRFDDRLPAGDFAFELGLQRCRGDIGSGDGAVPSSAKRATTFSSLSAFLSEALSLSIASAGVPFGT